MLFLNRGSSKLIKVMHEAKGNPSISDLSASSGVAYPYTYRSVRDFEKKGLVEVTEGESNSKRLLLTETGEELAEVIEEIWERVSLDQKT